MSFLTLAEARCRCNKATDDTSDDQLIQDLMTFVESYAAWFCRRTFEEEEIAAEYPRGTGTADLLLDKFPILEIDEINLDETMRFEVFVLRNVGNMVPPWAPTSECAAVGSAIEYAVGVLGVSDIVVCGHSHCGACAALYAEDQDGMDLQPPHRIRCELNGSWAAFHVEKYNSRPAHADQLHLDLWWHGYNLAQDPGTYLYNAPPPWENSLTSAFVHNTLVVDERGMIAGYRLRIRDGKREAVQALKKLQFRVGGDSTLFGAQHLLP